MMRRSVIRGMIECVRPQGLLVAGVVCLIVAAGCGSTGDHPPTAPVHGKVSYKGQPLKGGTVSFQPQGQPGNPALGDIQPDGTYSLTTYEKDDGAVLGKHAVTVTVFPGQGGAEEMGLPGTEAMAKSPIPTKYSDVSTSGLSFEVKDETNTADFDLQ
ncbi:MAG: hypothetical protein AB7O38_01665 [Pirellulaceae bacterium]